jgi:hypothetical protein
MIEKIKANLIPISIVTGLIVLTISFALGHSVGSASGFLDGYQKGSSEVSCDNGSHIPDPWKGKPKRK